MTLGGDHGKNSYMFLATISIRFNDNRETRRLEIKIGETNEEKCKIEFLKALIKKISYGWTRMNIDSEGDCHMSISDLSNLRFVSTSASDNCVLIKFFLIGGVK